MALLKPCLEGGCGALSDKARCPKHRTQYTKSSPRKRGYTTQWDKLSKRARSKQQFCSDCGNNEDLQCDHSAKAWEAQAKGLPITLDMVDVVCGPCNRRRGRAKPNQM